MDVDQNVLNWFNATLAASDDGSGMSVFEYRLDGGQWTPYTEAIHLTLSEGTHVLEYRGVDNLGNVRDVNYTFAFVKADAPGAVMVITISSESDGILITWTAPDNGGSRIGRYIIYRSVDGGALEIIGYSNTTSYLDTTAVEGTEYQYQIVPSNAVGLGAGSSLTTGKKIKPSELGISTFLLIVVAVAAVLTAVLFLVLRRRK